MTTNQKAHNRVFRNVLTDIVATAICYGLPLAGFLIALGGLGAAGPL